MAIITCPECSSSISDRAVSCPGCGCPTSNFSNCPECEKVILISSDECDGCGYPLTKHPDINQNKHTYVLENAGTKTGQIILLIVRAFCVAGLFFMNLYILKEIHGSNVLRASISSDMGIVYYFILIAITIIMTLPH